MTVARHYRLGKVDTQSKCHSTANSLGWKGSPKSPSDVPKPLGDPEFGYYRLLQDRTGAPAFAPPPSSLTLTKGPPAQAIASDNLLQPVRICKSVLVP